MQSDTESPDFLSSDSEEVRMLLEEDPSEDSTEVKLLYTELVKATSLDLEEDLLDFLKLTLPLLSSVVSVSGRRSATDTVNPLLEYTEENML